MRVTYICYLHSFTSMGIIAINVVRELTKLGIDVGLHVLNLHELTKNEIESFPLETQNAIKKGLRKDSIGIFFAYPDIYEQARCKINVGYTGADSSGWYITPHGSASIPCNKLMDYMLTPSDYSRKIMKNCGVSVPIELFPHGIDTDLFFPFKRTFSYPFTFLYTGELSERKGTQDLIKTFKNLYSGNKHYKLILRANSHMKHYGGQEIQDLCIDCSNIELVWKDEGQDDLINYFNKSHVYLYPSRADWYGMTPFESLATGLPTIATCTNGYYEFLKEHIIDLEYKEENIDKKHPYLLGKWNSPDLEDLEKLMINISNPETYENISEWTYQNSKKIIQDFSWEQVTKQYLIPFLERVEIKHNKNIIDLKRIICPNYKDFKNDM